MTIWRRVEAYEQYFFQAEEENDRCALSLRVAVVGIYQGLLEALSRVYVSRWRYASFRTMLQLWKAESMLDDQSAFEQRRKKLKGLEEEAHAEVDRYLQRKQVATLEKMRQERVSTAAKLEETVNRMEATESRVIASLGEIQAALYERLPPAQPRQEEDVKVGNGT